MKLRPDWEWCTGPRKEATCFIFKLRHVNFIGSFDGQTLWLIESNGNVCFALGILMAFRRQSAKQQTVNRSAPLFVGTGSLIPLSTVNRTVEPGSPVLSSGREHSAASSCRGDTCGITPEFYHTAPQGERPLRSRSFGIAQWTCQQGIRSFDHRAMTPNWSHNAAGPGPAEQTFRWEVDRRGDKLPFVQFTGFRRPVFQQVTSQY